MKYMLLIEMNPSAWEGLSESEQKEVFQGHGEFIKTITETGEMVSTEALADPSLSSVVRVRGGVRQVTDGPFAEAKEFFCGYYIVDCESQERALELAAQIPDARFSALEVRPLMNTGGTEV
jgi:hypothetical protein